MIWSEVFTSLLLVIFYLENKNKQIRIGKEKTYIIYMTDAVQVDH